MVGDRLVPPSSLNEPNAGGRRGARKSYVRRSAQRQPDWWIRHQPFIDGLLDLEHGPAGPGHS
jgi:hypothetical protein